MLYLDVSISLPCVSVNLMEEGTNDKVSNLMVWEVLLKITWRCLLLERFLGGWVDAGWVDAGWVGAGWVDVGWVLVGVWALIVVEGFATRMLNRKKQRERPVKWMPLKKLGRVLKKLGQLLKRLSRLMKKLSRVLRYINGSVWFLGTKVLCIVLIDQYFPNSVCYLFGVG